MSNNNNDNSNQEEEILDLLTIEDYQEESVDEKDKKTDDDTKDTNKDSQEEETDKDNSNEENNEEESEENSEEVEEPTVISSIMERLGYQAEENEEFTDDEDGIAELTRKYSEKLAKQYLDEKLTPVEKEFRKYVEMGGDPNFFLQVKFPNTDYTKVEFDTEDEDLQTRLVKEDLVARGYKGEELQAELDDIINGGILESKAKRALQALKSRQESEKASLVQRQEQEYQNQLQETKKYWEDLNKKITSATEIKGLKIPESDKSLFFNYLAKPVKDNKSQRIIDGEQLDEETVLLIDYLIYKKFDFSSLITRKAKDLQAKTLREKIRASKLDKQSQSRSTTSTAIEEIADIL